MKGSDSDIAGSSTGKPPACHTPRFTSSARDAQMRVAGVEIAPGIDDADDRLAVPIRLVIAELAQARPMPEGAQVADAQPAMAAELFRAVCVQSFAPEMHVMVKVIPPRGWLRGPPFPICWSRTPRFFRSPPACPELGMPPSAFELRQHLCVLEREVHLLLIRSMISRRRAFRRAQAEECAGFIARHRLRDAMERPAIRASAAPW